MHHTLCVTMQPDVLKCLAAHFILLLPWSTHCAAAAVDVQIPFLLDQFEAVQSSVGPTGWGRHKLAGRPLVILADKDKEEMDALVSRLVWWVVVCCVRRWASFSVLYSFCPCSCSLLTCSTHELPQAHSHTVTHTSMACMGATLSPFGVQLTHTPCHSCPLLLLFAPRLLASCANTSWRYTPGRESPTGEMQVQGPSGPGYFWGRYQGWRTSHRLATHSSVDSSRLPGAGDQASLTTGA